MIRITSRRLNGIPLQKAVAVLAIGIVVAACARTDYVGYDKETAPVPGVPLRTIAVEVDDAYFSDFPDCTIIMPTRTAAGLGYFKALVEEALAYHMTKKVSRVIGRTDAHAGVPTGEAYTPSDLAATIFHALGIGPETNFFDDDGRPYHIYRGEPIEALL